MNHWLFIGAAYALTFIGAAGVSIISWRAMRRAEAAAERLSDRA